MTAALARARPASDTDYFFQDSPTDSEFIACLHAVAYRFGGLTAVSLLTGWRQDHNRIWFRLLADFQVGDRKCYVLC